MFVSNHTVVSTKFDFLELDMSLLLETRSGSVSNKNKWPFSHGVKVTVLRMERVEGQDGEVCRLKVCVYVCVYGRYDDEKRTSALQAQPVDTLKVALQLGQIEVRGVVTIYNL